MASGFKVSALVIGILVIGLGTASPIRALEPAPGYALENGDVNGDWNRNLGDAVYLLNHLFHASDAPVPLAFCTDGTVAVQNGDTNADGRLNISDPIGLLGWLFGTAKPPASPCGLAGDGGGGSANKNPRVIPPHADPYGQSYGDWAAAWWQWAYSIPVDGHPLYDETGEDCGAGQSGPVFFLAGTYTTTEEGGVVIGVAERSECVVPAGKALFFPILNASVTNIGQEPPLTDEELLATAEFFTTDSIVDPHADIDGVEIQNLFNYLVQSPVVDFSFPEDNLDGVPPGTSNLASSGLHIMLAPLSRGEHHIHFSGAFVFTEEVHGFDFQFELDITYHLTVE